MLRIFRRLRKIRPPIYITYISVICMDASNTEHICKNTS